MTSMVSLFDPIRLGSIEAANRIFMAPMTRGRATRDHVTDDVAEAVAIIKDSEREEFG